jgi:hypothetical protein
MEIGRLWEQPEVLATIVAPWKTEGAENRTGRLSTPESPVLSLLHFLFYVKSGTTC